MIQFADDTTRQDVWNMWKSCFHDPDDYMEIYFRHKYRNENTLLYVHEGSAVASLQMLHYDFTFCGTEIPVIYLAGVCTLPAARRRGYTRQLLLRSFEEALKRDVPLMLLVPQEPWLLQFYGQYGFAQTFDPGTEPLPSLRDLTYTTPGDLQTAFLTFSNLYRRQDMTVQKSFDDFRAMTEEAALYDFPSKKNLTGMARVIDAERLLTLFAGHYLQASFSVVVHDPLLQGNNGSFTVAGGKAVRDGTFVSPAFSTGIDELAPLLLGYHTSGKPGPLRTIFPEKKPQMHFMLE